MPRGETETLSIDSLIYGDIEIPDVSMGIYARDLEHMAEILADTLPEEDPNRPFPVQVDGIGVVFFYCDGGYHD